MEAWLHPCIQCGACCAQFRVSFHWAETLPESFSVPTHLTYPVNAHLLAMQTQPQSVRCIALQGELGQKVNCMIYENRPSPCREFKASYEDGERDERCDRARLRIGLSPLRREDWKFTSSGTEV